MKKQKKILAWILAAVLLAGAVFGIGVAVKQTTGGKVLVVQAGSFNYGGWYDDENSMEGVVTSEMSQDVYVSSADTVEEVLVGEGDSVKTGQVLIRYDRTKTGLALKREELAYEQLLLNIEVAEKNIETLNRLRPYVEPSETEPEEPGGEEEEEEDIPATVYTVLDGDSVPYNANDKTAGTASNPLRFLCSSDCVVTADFLRMMMNAAAEAAEGGPEEEEDVPASAGDAAPGEDGYTAAESGEPEGGTLYFMLEVREGDSKDGALIRAWIRDAGTLQDVEDDWRAEIYLREIIEEKTLVERFGDQKAKDELKELADAYNASDDAGDLGTAENPYRFLVKEGTVITKSFIDALQSVGSGVCFQLETRSGDRLSGGLTAKFLQNADSVSLTGDWKGIVNFKDNEKPVIDTGDIPQVKAVAKAGTGGSAEAVFVNNNEESSDWKLIAAPDDGYVFEKWNKDGKMVSTDNPYSVTISEDTTFEAVFKELPAQNIPKATASAEPSNAGSVQATLFAGQDKRADWTLSVISEADGYVFEKWTDSSGNVVVSTDAETRVRIEKDTAYKAVFVKAAPTVRSYDLTAEDYNDAAGSAEAVRGNKKGENGIGNKIWTLTAEPAEGFNFRYWAPEGRAERPLTDQNPLEVEISQDIAYIAVFEKDAELTETPTPAPEDTPTPSPEPEETPSPTPSSDPETSGDGGEGDESGSGGNQGTALNGKSSGTFAYLDNAETVTLKGPEGSIVNGAKFTRVAAGGEDEDLGVDLSSVGLIPANAQYTKEDLEEARKDAANALRDLKLDLREAELRLHDARVADEEGEVKAKMDGTVRHVGDISNPVGDGSPFISVTGSGGQYIRCGLSELLLDEVEIGDPVRVTSWETGSEYNGIIRDISPYPDTSGYFGYGDSTATYYTFMVQLLEEKTDLTDSTWVQVAILRGDSGEEEADSDEFFLWKAFIRDEDGRKYVYKEGEDGLLHKEWINVGRLSGEGYKIISGVAKDDYIAFPYGKGVKEGVKTRRGSADELYGAG